MNWKLWVLGFLCLVGIVVNGYVMGKGIEYLMRDDDVVRLIDSEGCK